MMRIGLLVIASLFAASEMVLAKEIRFDNFQNLAGFSLNGAVSDIRGSTGNISALRLTNNLNQSSSAFLKERFKIAQNASFSTYFQFRITEPMGWTDGDNIQGADGIAFVIQTQAASIGGSGGGIGYAGINKSLAIEFDTWNNGSSDRNNGNHIGININGDTNSVTLQELPTPFNNGNVWHCWIDFDGVKKLLEVRISDQASRPAKALLTHSLQLLPILQQPDVFIGFSSGTGSAGNVHDILAWQFRGDFSPISSVALSELNFVWKKGNRFEKIIDVIRYKQVFFLEAIFTGEPQGSERTVQLSNMKGTTAITVQKTKENPRVFRSKSIILRKAEK